MMKKFFIVRSKGKYKKLFVDEILYCKASGSYTAFYLFGFREVIWACYLLKEVEKMLVAGHFFRISRSCLVNLDHCHEIIGNTNQVVLSNGKKLTMSGSKMTLLIKAFCAY